MSVQEIRIRKDGKWYADGAEMFRKPFLNLFGTHLHRDENGQYYIELNNETFYIVVEDVPFLAIDAGVRDGSIVFLLHDQQMLEVNEEVKLHMADDKPYLSFKWDHDTLINRSAFWMVSEFLEERDDGVYLVPPASQQQLA
ncbi:MAG: DUF1285 domain-containing protein [Solirubrobacterales bacterium]